MGFLQSIFLCNNIIHAYTERISIEDARTLFGEMTEPNVVSWTNLISGYAHMGKLTQAVALFRRMQKHNNGEGKEDRCIPNCFTFGSILKGCTHTKDLQTGMQIHCATVKYGFESDTFIASTLVHMYAKFGQIESSWKVFAQTEDKDVVTWTSMVTGFANHMHPEFKNAAFILFKDMIRNGIWPLGVTIFSLIKVFNEPTRLNQAKQVHGCLLKLGIEVDCQLGSSLVDMYGKCEGIDEAIKIFLRLDQKDVVSWTSLLVAYLNNGLYVEAINVFRRMVVEKIPVDPFVVAGVVGVCSGLEKMVSGKEVHGFAIRKGFISDVAVGNSIITFYGRWGDVKKAKIVFQGMEVRDAISWTALLSCFTQTGFGEEALFLFQKMCLTGLSLPVFIITCAIKACSTIASLSVANQLHSRTIKMGYCEDLSVRNSLIAMYAKCGDIDIALRLFNSMSRRDTISWNAIIAALSQHGFGKEALERFHIMKMEGFQPDNFTLLGVLVSCSNIGLVNEGYEYFKSMTIDYNLKPKMEHYASIVSLLGRAGSKET
ncbi:pentatricopeptide repeat-containing protein At4g13650-like [Telopea speciosissima]|uniref:pentatricopeptide repeat-containing protein At4g13650-like n=1 Tax=Telopea speciosissima TaxID=54955 RepID=UPI001CC4858C|nr:pentatricopeptide repeat-containing protein At4g13650-like [Telopea speciosissima]